MIHIARLKCPLTLQDVEDINCLNSQLSSNSGTTSFENLYQFMFQQNVIMVIARDQKTSGGAEGHIVGKACVHITDLDDKTRKVTVEQVVVNKQYRGQGIANKIDDEILEIAKTHHASLIFLTSNPSRVTANKFYLKRGYVRQKTNVYRKILT